MPKVTVYNMSGKMVSEMELSDAVFGVEVSVPAMHQVIVAQQANARQGTQSARTMSEVKGGGKKPFRQKGTGRARQGSTRAPQWRHGGMVFAVKPRSYRKQVNKKIRRLAMKSALTSKVAAAEMIILESLALEAPKTREVVALMKNLGVTGKAMVVTAQSDADVLRAANNIPTVEVSPVGTLNVYDIMKNGKFIVTRDAVALIEEVFA